MSCWCDDAVNKENLQFDYQSKQVDFFVCVAVFCEETENMFSVFLSSLRNTNESLGELEKAVETLPWHSSFYSNFYFYFLNIVVLCFKNVFF